MELIKLFQGKQKIINIPRGPQFNTKGNHIVAIITLVCLIIGVSLLMRGAFISGIMLFLLSFILLFYILDFHGFELDKSTHQIRDYKNFMWIKIGKWQNLHDFHSIYLTKAHLVLPTSYYSEVKSETYHYYHIKLVDESNKKELFLAEYTNYYKAFNIAENVARMTGLELKDFVKGLVKN